MSNKIVCAECVNKQEEIYRLREENKRLKAKLRLQERNITEGYFGSSTPSSKKPVKKTLITPTKKKTKAAVLLAIKSCPAFWLLTVMPDIIKRSVLKTLKLRIKADTRTAFKEFLNKLAENPKLDIYQTLFPKPEN